MVGPPARRQPSRCLTAVLSCAAVADGLSTAAAGSRSGARWAGIDRAAESCRPASPDGKVVLVTGTGGFVGYFAARALKSRGDGVVGLDNFNSYYPVNLKRERQRLLENEGVVTIEADLNDEAALAALARECKFTHVLNLAAQAGVRYAIQDPDSYVKSNIQGFVKVLEWVRKMDPMPSVVYASSSSVYGTNDKMPFSESDPVDHPASLYAATKRENELLAHTYSHIYHIPLIGLRFFTVYGPLSRPDMAVFGFANKMLQGEAVRIFTGPGGSELERDFTYIDDIVQGCLGAIDHVSLSRTALEARGVAKDAIPEPTLKVYNLGNERPNTVSRLVDLVEEAIGQKAIREYVPLPPTGDVLRTYADIAEAKRDLGYSPKTTLDEGIKKFGEWYKAFYPNGLDNQMKAYKGY